jgi:hypothetical protein
VLVEKETIYTEDVALLMKGASYKEVIEAMDSREQTHRDNPFASMTSSKQATQDAQTMPTEDEQKTEQPKDEE